MILDLLESIYKKVKKTHYMSAGFAGRHVVGFGDLSIDVFLEVQNQSYSWILYLIDYIVYGLHLWYNIFFQENLPRTYFPTSWLSDKSATWQKLSSTAPLVPEILSWQARGKPAEVQIASGEVAIASQSAREWYSG